MKNVLIVLLLLAVGWGVYERATLNGRIAVLEHQKQTVDTVYQAQTKTLVKVRRVTDSILAVDTLWRTDTVRVLVAAERKACDAVISSCAERVRVRDEMIRTLKKKPSVISKLPWIVGGMLAGKLLLK